MMTDKTNWQASLIEQRIAWGTTFCAMIIAILAAAQPQWFEFSFATNKPIQQQAPVGKAVQPIHSENMATNADADKSPPVKATPVKPVTIQPVRQSTQAPPVDAKPAKKKGATTTKKKSYIAHGFYVQLGAFEEKNRAHGLADQLKRKGWSVKITDKKGGLHAVWIGPKSTKADAEKLLKSIRSKLKYKGFIVQHNNG